MENPFVALGFFKHPRAFEEQLFSRQISTVNNVQMFSSQAVEKPPGIINNLMRHPICPIIQSSFCAAISAEFRGHPLCTRLLLPRPNSLSTFWLTKDPALNLIDIFQLADAPLPRPRRCPRHNPGTPN